MSKVRYLIAVIGSYGDILPGIGLGSTLRARGHDVTLITTSYFAPIAERAGLDFFDPMPDRDYKTSLNHPDLWHPTRGIPYLLEIAGSAIRPLYETILDRYVPGETVVVASSLGFGARIAQEAHGIPTATMHLSPCLLRTKYGAVNIGRIYMPAWMPGVIKHLPYRIIDRLAVDRILGPTVNQLRRELRLPEVHRVMDTWYHSPELVLAMYPKWFAARQPDTPPNTLISGFPRFDSGVADDPAPDLVEFVAKGAPIVFTHGTANAHAKEFFQTCSKACRRLGRRGILLTRFPELVPKDLPPSVRAFDYVPFSWLLPRSAAMVHHGGVGSIAQAFAAGIPQLIKPMSFDQHDNASRVESLGCGESLTPIEFNASNVARRLDHLLNSPSVATACRQAAARMSQGNPLEQACEALEALAASRAVPVTV